MSHLYVTVEKGVELLGLTRQAIYARIKRREWLQGIHYIKKGARIFLNVPAIYAWIAQG